MALNLFIDTNIFLSFYHLTSENLDELKKLTVLLERSGIYLHLPEQVTQEFQRNREAKIADAMNRLGEHRFNFQFPQMCKGYPEYETLRAGMLDCDAAHKSLMKSLKKDILNEQLEADKIISEIFGAARFIKTGEFLDRARVRKELGNPPGKSNSLCDGVNWETLLAEVPAGEDLYFISDDKDFRSLYEKERLHPFLAKEWRMEKNSEIHFYTKLSYFFRDQYPDIRLSEDLEKLFSINDLIYSPNFLSTHAAVAKLRKYGNDFTEHQLNLIVYAVVSNEQVGRIIGDEDVQEFLVQLIDGRVDQIAPELLSMLPLLPAPLPSGGKAGYVEDEDIPF